MSTFSLVFLLLFMYLPFLLPFLSLSRQNSRWALAVLIPSLHAQTVSLYSSEVLCLCFHLLYAFFLCLSFVMSSLFIHAGLLLPLFDFLHSQMDIS